MPRTLTFETVTNTVLWGGEGGPGANRDRYFCRRAARASRSCFCDWARCEDAALVETFALAGRGPGETAAVVPPGKAKRHSSSYYLMS